MHMLPWGSPPTNALGDYCDASLPTALMLMGCLVLRGLQLYHRLQTCKNGGP